MLLVNGMYIHHGRSFHGFGSMAVFVFLNIGSSMSCSNLNFLTLFQFKPFRRICIKYALAFSVLQILAVNM